MYVQICDTIREMHRDDESKVGLRELRHRTKDVFDRVRNGETIDVTERGRPIARITPIIERTPTPVMARLIEQGRARAASRPGFRPSMRPGTGDDLLSDTLAALRDAEGR